VNVATWLKDLGLERYATAFQSNAVDVELLPRLTAEDLKDLGVVLVGDRRRLLDAIAALGVDGDAAAPPRLRSVTLAPADGELRQVTVLFADLVGYTA
jgi:class 3 adenylate cyclase